MDPGTAASAASGMTVYFSVTCARTLVKKKRGGGVFFSFSLENKEQKKTCGVVCWETIAQRFLWLSVLRKVTIYEFMFLNNLEKKRKKKTVARYVVMYANVLLNDRYARTRAASRVAGCNVLGHGTASYRVA